MPCALQGASVLVTGSTGFLGRHVCSLLREWGCRKVVGCSLRWHRDDGHVSHQRVCDLTHPTEVAKLFLAEGPFDFVFHLAGFNGGISFNLERPADIFRDNTMMALNVLDRCSLAKVGKVVSVVASCAYPNMEWHGGCEAEVMNEKYFLGSPPHDSVACHGYAKRNLQLATSFYKKQYGLNAVCVCPTTLYGPGDSFDTARTKVMGALIHKFTAAKRTCEQEVVVWGSGRPLREFLFVKDAARLIVESMEHYDNSDMPLNLGTGQEMSIAAVSSMVADAVGYSGRITFDTSKPDGQYRKRLDLTRMKEVFPDYLPLSLGEGIRETVEWYRGTVE